jgi:hypothetical protein
MDPGCVLQQKRFVALSNAAAASADAGDDIDVALRALAFDACACWLLLGPRRWVLWSKLRSPNLSLMEPGKASLDCGPVSLARKPIVRFASAGPRPTNSAPEVNELSTRLAASTQV